MQIKISKNTGRTLPKYGRRGDLKRMGTNILVRQAVHIGIMTAIMMGDTGFLIISLFYQKNRF